MKNILLITVFIALVIFGCKKDDEDSIPTASFTVNMQANIASITNKSSNYESSTWEFGDGNSANIQKSEEAGAFSYTYASVGTYTIKLTVRGEGGVNSVTKSVTVSSLPPTGEGAITAATDIDVTQFTANYTLESGEIAARTNHYLQLSKTNDFAVLEDVDGFSSDVQEEVKLGASSTSYTIKNLIPEQLYFYRIKTTYDVNTTVETTYSNIGEVTSLTLPQATVTTAEEGLFSFKISSSLAINDITVVYDIAITAARDADFTDMVTLERRPFNNTYYREAGTNLYIKATATVNGKTSEKVIEYNTSENFITGNTDFNASGTFASLSENNTVLTIGTDGGERIEYRFLDAVTEGNSFNIENGNDPTKNRAIYYTADGTLYEYHNNTAVASIYFYKITDNHAYVRLGSATDTDIYTKFSDPNSSESINISGFIIKAAIN